MTRVKSFLFYTMATAIFCYSAWELGLITVSADSAATAVPARRCCTYQTHCLSTQTCVTISPACSATRPHICQTNPVSVEPVEVEPVEAVP